MQPKKNNKNYLIGLPGKQELKISGKNIDKIMEKIKKTNIETDDVYLLSFYDKLIKIIERKFINPISGFDIPSYLELRNNISKIDEEFIKQYGDNIINYIEKDECELIRDIEKIDKEYEFTIRNEKTKKTVMINNELKEIYITEKRNIKQFDFMLYMSEISSLINGTIYRKINEYLKTQEINETFFNFFSNHEETIYNIVKDNIESTFGFLKNSEISVYNDLYEYNFNKIKRKILYSFKSVVQSSIYKERDIFKEYLNQAKPISITKKLKREINHR